VTSDSQPSVSDQGPLKEAQLYGGSFDADTQLVLRSYSSCAGDLAVGIARAPDKNGPVEDSAALVPLREDGLALMVADGVGGLPTGWKASGITLEKVCAALKDAKNDDALLRNAILDGIDEANGSLRELGTGTSTTLVVAEIRDQQVRTFHIGDSSAWICGQRGVMKLQTTPHSPVGFALEAGFVNEKEALHHEDLNLVSNVVGSADMRIEIGSRLPLAPKDTLLIASDGLFDNVLESEIVEIIRTGSVADSLLQLWQLTARRMAGTAKTKPSKPDDFSAILLRPTATANGATNTDNTHNDAPNSG
jgi:serine/threonine protein phosphatase PrpC